MAWSSTGRDSETTGQFISPTRSLASLLLPHVLSVSLFQYQLFLKVPTVAEYVGVRSLAKETGSKKGYFGSHSSLCESRNTTCIQGVFKWFHTTRTQSAAPCLAPSLFLPLSELPRPGMLMNTLGEATCEQSRHDSKQRDSFRVYISNSMKVHTNTHASRGILLS